MKQKNSHSLQQATIRDHSLDFIKFIFVSKESTSEYFHHFHIDFIDKKDSKMMAKC
jgi:hypothetical protein